MKRTSSAAPLVFLSVISLVLAIGFAIVLRQYFESRQGLQHTQIQLADSDSENQELLSRLNNLDEAYASLQTGNQQMQQQLTLKREEIESLRTRVRQGEQAQALRGRVNELEQQLDYYRQEVEMLLAENQALSGENAQILSTLDQTTAHKNRLEQQVETMNLALDIARQLQITNLQVIPLRQRRSGVRPTSRARNTSMLQVCFTVSPNHLAEQGQHTFFLQLEGPTGELWSAQRSFTMQEQTVPYTFQHSFHYQGNEENVCAEWLTPEMVKGHYSISVYSRHKSLGSTSFELN